jgi:hypothetical protein
MTGLSHWRVFGARYGTHTYFDQHIVGCRPLPRLRPVSDEQNLKKGYRQSR